jgi:hypothetical protein
MCTTTAAVSSATGGSMSAATAMAATTTATLGCVDRRRQRNRETDDSNAKFNRRHNFLSSVRIYLRNIPAFLLLCLIKISIDVDYSV